MKISISLADTTKQLSHEIGRAIVDIEKGRYHDVTRRLDKIIDVMNKETERYLYQPVPLSEKSKVLVLVDDIATFSKVIEDCRDVMN